MWVCNKWHRYGWKCKSSTFYNGTININILNFNYLDGEGFIKRYGLFEKESKISLTDLLEYIFVELPKFTEANKDYNNKLHKWLTFLSNPTGKEIEKFMKTDVEIKEAMDVLYKISGDKEAIMLAEMREKAIMDEQNRLNGARKEGLDEGRKEGLDEGRKEGLDEGRKEGLKETILDNLSEIGNVPQNLIDCINKQNNLEVLKFWTKIAVMAKSLAEFEEKM